MAASTRFLSAIAVAFVAGVASTSAYMSRGDAHRDAPRAPHGASPSLSERLRAEAHGQSLPWSDPVKAKPEPSKLTFTPGLADAPVKEGRALADEGRTPGPQATPVPAPVRPPDDGGRSHVRLAQSDGQTLPPEEDQADLAPTIKRARPPEEDVGPSRAKMVEAPGPAPTSRDDGARPYQAPQSSRTASQPDGEAGHPRAMSAKTPRHVLPPVQEHTRISVAEAPPRARASDAGDRRPLARTADVSVRVRTLQEDDRPRSRMMEAPVRARLADLGSSRPRLRVTDIPQHVRTPDPENGKSRLRTAEARHPIPRARPVRNLPSLAAVDDIRDAVRRAASRRERVSVAPPYRTAGYEDRDDIPRVREVYVVRRDEEPDDEPRVVVRRRAADSDGLMRWLSGPSGRF